MKKTRPLVLLPSILAMHLLGCGGGEPSAKAPDNATPMSNSDTVSSDVASIGPTTATTSSSLPTPAPAEAQAPNPPPEVQTELTDEQILQITHTANLGEIAQAKLAQSKTRDARVRQLAVMMFKDHTAADAKGMAIAKKDNMTPAQSTTSTSIASDVESATSTLMAQNGVAFDKGYVDIQVKEHQAVLDVIDQRLMPSAKDPDVKAFLAEVRPKIAMHLQHAQDLRDAMQK